MVGRRRTGARLADRTGTACRAEAVSKVYGRRETAVHALRDVTLGIPSGAFTAIMGPSGSGKSTLLHCLAALDTPTSGQVFLGRTELTALTRRQQAQVRRDRIGFVFQAFNLVPTLDAIENITLPQLLAGRRPDRDWLDHIVRQMGLADRLHHRPSELSGGQQQRVALARALAGRPEVIFADEPTGNLDTSASQDMLALLRDAVDQFEQTVITVTHDPSIARYADRVLFLKDGQVVDQALRPDVDQALERLRFSDGAGAGPDELHAPRPDGQDSMRSRRRRQPDEPTPGRPMVGSDDEVEVARQERWLQRIREQFEAEQQHVERTDDQPAEADPWATEPAIEHEAQPSAGRWRTDPTVDRREAGAGRDGSAMPPAPALGAGTSADDDWLPPMRSSHLRDEDAAAPTPAPPPHTWRREHVQDEAPWSRPGGHEEHEDQQTTTSQWAPPDSDWPPLERGRSGSGWRTDTGGWRQRRAELQAEASSGDHRDAWAADDDHRDAWSPPTDDDHRDRWADAGDTGARPGDDHRWRHRDEAADPWTRPRDDRDRYEPPAGQHDLPWASRSARQDRPWSPPADDHAARSASPDDRLHRGDAPPGGRWSDTGDRADWRALRDGDQPRSDDPDEDPDDATGQPPAAPPPERRRAWDPADDQPVGPPQYQSWQPTDGGDEVNGFHQPDAPPRSPSRNGFHQDDRADDAADRGRRPADADERPATGQSGHEAPAHQPPPPAQDADRGHRQPLDDPWSNVWDASSGIDVGDVWSPTVDHGALERGTSPHEPDTPGADDAAPPDATHGAPPDDPGGDDEIVQPVLHPDPAADDQPAIPRLEEPDFPAVTDPPVRTRHDDGPQTDAPSPATAGPVTHQSDPDEQAGAEPVVDRPAAHDDPVDDRPAEDPVDERPADDRPAAGEASPRPAASAPGPAEDAPTPAAPALADEPVDDHGTQPLPALAEVAHDEPVTASGHAEPATTPAHAEPATTPAHADRAATPAHDEPQTADERGAPPWSGDDDDATARPRRPRQRRPQARAGEPDLPAALASLRNTRRPDETADPMVALQSLQAQLDRLGSTGGRSGAHHPRRPGRDRSTRRRDRD